MDNPHIYAPDPAFVDAIERELVASIPFLFRAGVKLIPRDWRLRATLTALTEVIPLSLSSIALTRRAGDQVKLATVQDLAKEVKGGMLKRIALWLVADTATEVVLALHAEVRRIAVLGLRNESWAVIIENEEVFLLVLDTSRLKESTDTVADLFFNSFDSLKGLGAKILGKLGIGTDRSNQE